MTLSVWILILLDSKVVYTDSAQIIFVFLSRIQISSLWLLKVSKVSLNNKLLYVQLGSRIGSG